MKKHIIAKVQPNSIAEECGFEKGDILLKINDSEIEDAFDYQFLTTDEFLVLTVESKQGEIVEIEVEKDAGEDLGLEFENSFMDDYRSCRNKCIFCFIDQMPPGMRETLYFKDDDTRLSFLQGNYVTLTNISDEDISRIIRYRMEPINISFQTMNKELRCMMLHNRFAGDALRRADELYEAGIEMNGQIVLCKDVNDKAELEYSIEQLYKYVPVLRSVSVVPVGLSKFREGLYPLKPFEKEDAEKTIDMIEKWQKKAFSEKGLHFIHASDEWYFLAGRDFPEEERYDGYLQLENGVGMVRNYIEEFKETFIEQFGQSRECAEIISNFEKRIHNVVNDKKAEDTSESNANKGRVRVSLATGLLFAPVLKACIDAMNKALPEADFEVYPIRNDFFGERITVAGLITATDLTAQLKEKEIGEALIIPDTMLRYGEAVFLDDITVSELETALHCRVDIVKSTGRDLVEILMKYVTK